MRELVNNNVIECRRWGRYQSPVEADLPVRRTTSPACSLGPKTHGSRLQIHLLGPKLHPVTNESAPLLFKKAHQVGTQVGLRAHIKGIIPLLARNPALQFAAELVDFKAIPLTGERRRKIEEAKLSAIQKTFALQKLLNRVAFPEFFELAHRLVEPGLPLLEKTGNLTDRSAPPGGDQHPSVGSHRDPQGALIGSPLDFDPQITEFQLLVSHEILTAPQALPPPQIHPGRILGHLLRIPARKNCKASVSSVLRWLNALLSSCLLVPGALGPEGTGFLEASLETLRAQRQGAAIWIGLA